MELFLTTLIEIELPAAISDASNFLSSTVSTVQSNLLLIKITLGTLTILLGVFVVYLLAKSLQVIKLHKGLDIHDFFGVKKDKYYQEINKIDLHIHTNYSDGLESPTEIVERAYKKKIDVIAITDHDSVLGVEEAINKGNELGVTVVPGVEISTNYKDKVIHILGLGINIKNEKLNSLLEEIAIARKKHFINQLPKINNKLKKESRNLIDPGKYNKKDLKYYSFSGLADFLVEESVVKDKEEAMSFISVIEKHTPTFGPWDVFEVIKDSGGKSFLSHPFSPLVSLKEISKERDEQERVIKELKKDGLDGLEVYHSGHDKDDVSYALDLCDRNNLLISSGSDWHGPFKKVSNFIKSRLPNYPKELGDFYVPKDQIDSILEGIEVIIELD